MNRLTTQDYFRAALEIVGEQGSDGLTIATLCARLSITKGSFYHHFGSLPGFVEQLLSYWVDEHSDRLIAAAQADAEAIARLDTLIEIALGLPHATEAALRAWGRSRPDVAASVAAVDRSRERHSSDAIAALGIDRSRARLLGRIALNLLIGTQQREHPVDVKRLRATFEEYRKLLLVEADPHLARLVAN